MNHIAIGALVCSVAMALSIAIAFADPVMNWGASWAALSECDEADACVTVTNHLTGSDFIEEGSLSLDWITVGVRAEMEPGDVPDTVTITAPPGYLVDPPFAAIEEGATVVFRIFFPAMG